MNHFYIYYLRRPDKKDPLESGDGQPFYVGKGSNGRLGDHRKEAEYSLNNLVGKHPRIHIIHKLWRQGFDFIEEIMFDNLTEQEAFELEIEAISVYGRIDIGTGCLANLTDGGEGGMSGYIFSKETREKMGKSRIGKHYALGYHHTDDAKRRIGEAQTGRFVSKETRRKLSESQKGEKSYWYGKKHTEEHKQNVSVALKENHPFRGKYHSLETKEKMSVAKKGKPWTEARRKAQETRSVSNADSFK